MLPDIRQSKRLTVLYHLTLDKTAAVRNEQRLHSIFQYQIPLFCAVRLTRTYRGISYLFGSLTGDNLI